MYLPQMLVQMVLALEAMATLSSTAATRTIDEFGWRWWIVRRHVAVEVEGAGTDMAAAGEKAGVLRGGRGGASVGIVSWLRGEGFGD